MNKVNSGMGLQDRRIKCTATVLPRLKQILHSVTTAQEVICDDEVAISRQECSVSECPQLRIRSI